MMTPGHEYLPSSVLRLLFLDTPKTWWTSLLFWLIRIATLSLFLRTFLIPWAFSVMSKHVRIRSISLWSIRGLYVRNGAKVFRVDRLSYSWSHTNGLNVRLLGLSIEIGKEETVETFLPSLGHGRRLTLADFAPSPMAHRLWRLALNFYILLEPYFRPLIRTCVVACLRIFIRWLPHIVEGLTFDLQSTSLTFPELPGTRISAGKSSIHAKLSFTQLGTVIDTLNSHETPRPVQARRLYGVAAWRKRLTASFQRSLERAWGKAQGSVAVTLKLHDITGSTRQLSVPTDRKDLQFLRLPGAIDFEASMSFHPREGTVDAQSLVTTLTIGHCLVQLDALKLLLDNLKGLHAPQPMPNVDSPDIITPASPKPLVSALMTPTSQAELLLSSPGGTPPISALLSREARTPVSIASPTSPLLQALSASIRSRRRYAHYPRSKLKDVRDTSVISILRSAHVSLSTITLLAEPNWGVGSYEAIIQDVNMSCYVCDDPSRFPLQRQWFGKAKKVDIHDPDVYGLKFSVRQVALERRTKLDSLRVLTMGVVDIEALATQWPAPWLAASPFMRGDPNAPFLVVRASIAGIDTTERIECLRQLVACIGSISKPVAKRRSNPPKSYRLPRISCELCCGTVRARIICEESGPLFVELRSNGFVASATSRFRRDPSPRQSLVSDASLTCLRMDYRFSVVLQPNLIRIRSAVVTRTTSFTDLHSSDADFLNDPPLLSMESFEVFGEGHAIASVTDDTESVALVSLVSQVLDLHVSTDALCLELWHPNVVNGAFQLLSLIRRRSDNPALQHSSRLLDRVPMGISATLAFGRLVVFVTAPDINPNEAMDLSRGFAMRTCLSINYSSMHSSQADRFHDLPKRTKARQILCLPREQTVDAVAAAQTSVSTNNITAYIRISLTDVALRSAVATQYDADDPLIAERDDPALKNRECIRIPNIGINLLLSGKRHSVPSQTCDSCEIYADIPYVCATFKLAHMYCMLLAFQTLRSLLPVSSSNIHVPLQPSSLLCGFRAVIPTVQIVFILPKEKLAIRIDGIDIHSSPDKSHNVRLSSTLVWVCLPSQLNRWNEDVGEKWEELLSLHTWDISFLPSADVLSILADGDGARLRIPFGYILADLIFDAAITAKALRHLLRVTAMGRYVEIPTPAPEEPKRMPSLTVRVRCLCLEASDDPFENKLAVIWRCGLEAVKQRMDREDAFSAKVAAIRVAEAEVLDTEHSTHDDNGYQFGAKHSVSIEEARRRLDEVHALDWTLRLQRLREKCFKSEDFVKQRLRGSQAAGRIYVIPNVVNVSTIEGNPPLFRAMFSGLSLIAQPPSFPIRRLPDFLYEQGRGLPRDSQFSLLMPMHLRFSLSSLHMTLRDYPLPLFSIPTHRDPNTAAWEFEADLVVGEEMGTDLSVDWIACPIVDSHYGIYGASPMSILVPKTIMPVKTYADPIVRVTTNAATIFSWSISYTAAIHDLMRVFESLTSLPRDSSPVIGFWDKIKLVFHWTLEASFKGEVRFHMKGTRDPYQVTGAGAGFVLSWQGNTKLLIGRQNEDSELIQVISDSMCIAIPNLEHLAPQNQRPSHASQIPESSKPYQKICAKLRSGVRFGIGFVLERSCGEECLKCSGTAFQRHCRHFDFRPHYEVKLEKKRRIPFMKGPEDSYNFFRSDFIHLSISLTSSTRSVTHRKHHHHQSSSLHLTPKSFAQFWSWCALFDGVLSLPIRQGTYYPPRHISPKLGRHLATVKYRVNIRRLFISHAYIDESRETWVDGVIPWVGVKAMIDEFQVDMHQREEEATVPGPLPNTMKITHHKPFYAAEVVLQRLDMRAMLATFDEDLRQAVQMTAPPERSSYRAYKGLPAIGLSSSWYDADDFVETDWSPSDRPTLHLLPVATCPHVTYFKRNSAVLGNATERSKFGIEQSHTCLLGEEQTVPQVQVSLVSNRILELKRQIRHKADRNEDPSALEKMASLLEDYVTVLQVETTSEEPAKEATPTYAMPSHTVSPDEWAEFENVYQIHCPKIYMDAAIRDIMMKYYYCSRARKGLEYHLATRAVKFIRDQADAALAIEIQRNDHSRDVGNPAQLAASALRKMLKGDYSKSSTKVPTDEHLDTVDPLNGWSSGVSLRKSHCCLLLKPQIVMSGEEPKNTCIVAAVQAKLQSFVIMDDSHADDPVSGKVMSRNYTSLRGLQSFSPAGAEILGDRSVPLEVLVDLRCESSDFDRIVPQTDAIFHYDKFNRLRLRSKVTSVARPLTGHSDSRDYHLQDQTDLIRVHIPRFTVSAGDEQFQAISHIVTKLLLFSDAAHKTRLDKLETLLFTYDFTDLASAANVISGLQSRLKDAMEAQEIAENTHSRRLQEEEGKMELLKLKAHIFLLTEELNLLFDAIKLAQDRLDDRTDQKSALLLHTSSSEISWHMLDDRRDLLSKLVVQEINFHWLNRQDSSTGNNLTVGNLQAFDGSRHALWVEILSKYDEPLSHPLVKRGLFLLASWTVLPPVGGITIYGSFELSLHPMRLQIDARVGTRIMEYLWPERRQRHIAAEHVGTEDMENLLEIPPKSPFRTSIDSPRGLHPSRADTSKSELLPPLRRLGTSRSFTDLKSAKNILPVPALRRMHSSEALDAALDAGDGQTVHRGQKTGDAAEMKTRASQKSFVLVRISSLSLLLSIVKEGSFECHDARIQTRDLEYHNQTWSVEELVNQFIPSNMSWRGWIKMAFHQPLLPVFPVARELLSKTKWIASSSKVPLQIDGKGPPPKLPRAKVLSMDDDAKLDSIRLNTRRARSKSPHRGWLKVTRQKTEESLPTFTTLPLTEEPEPLAADARPPGRRRLKSLFARGSSNSTSSSSTLR